MPGRPPSATAAELFVPFSADLFSQPKAEPTPAVHGPEVVALLAEHYPALGAVRTLESCGGFGVNSVNLKVGAEAGQVVLKCKPGGVSEALFQQASFAQMLSDRTALPLPPFVKNSAGGLVTEKEGAAWIVQTFAPGEYFKGDERQLESYLDVLIDVTRILSEPWTDEFPLPPLNASYVSVLEDLSAPDFEVTAWCPTLKEPLRSVLDSLWPTVVRPAIDRAGSQLLAEAPRPCHIDLHPHNVLMAGDTVAAILDWESFLYGQQSVFVGFSIIKMGRQSVAAGRDLPAIRSLLQAACDGLETPVERIIAAGTAEILRRVHYVLTINRENGDESWNMVLPLLLQNLSEAQQLIKPVSAR